MAKALFCMECGHIETFDPQGNTTRCKCRIGPVVGWWVDMTTAQVQMAVLPPGEQGKARVVLMHNGFLRADTETIPSGFMGSDRKLHPFQPQDIDQQWRVIHEQATLAPPRPEALTVFGLSRRACSLVVQMPGTTPDTFWASEPELLRRGLLETVRA